ncbi:DUF4406 domain-containing protein [Halomonas daqingensis]|uniref:DUF4406 domain-containing protein n=1 Tax=Billgrantia desiderata TaxID=52021 RepID=A0ABS9B4D4_9GAMM|nr:DUF4406 domain-containing protein [Halomonas desiderata]MCE8042483.1 DUF4406 domain-containing protein [Halomonas desiderata]MCE8047058.1 DUF4406 domain-containing protein [Halomonas desiderata]
MKRIYISGPMTGLPGLNFSAFHMAARQLRALGYEVVNPAEKQSEAEDLSWEEYLKQDLQQMLTCDTLALLPGWQSSKGAHLELHVAHRVGMNIVDVAAIHREELEGVPA